MKDADGPNSGVVLNPTRNSSYPSFRARSFTAATPPTIASRTDG